MKNHAKGPKYRQGGVSAVLELCSKAAGKWGARDFLPDRKNE